MEKWLPVVGFEGLYDVSSLGNVRSLDRVQIFKSKKGLCRRVIKGRVLKQKLLPNGYKQIQLYKKNGESKLLLVHRIVAIAFLKNEDNKPCVDHKNSKRFDNRVDNLCWVTYLENNRKEEYRSRKSVAMKSSEKARKSLKNIQQKRKKLVIDVDSGEIFESAYHASVFLGYKNKNQVSTNIMRGLCSKGRKFVYLCSLNKD